MHQLALIRLFLSARSWGKGGERDDEISNFIETNIDIACDLFPPPPLPLSPDGGERELRTRRVSLAHCVYKGFIGFCVFVCVCLFPRWPPTKATTTTTTTLLYILHHTRLITCVAFETLVVVRYYRPNMILRLAPRLMTL